MGGCERETPPENGSVLENLKDQLRFNKLTDSITWNL